MTDLLSAADIAALRREEIGDEINTHTEFGTASKVATNAAIGAASVALKGLSVGTITRGTPFSILSGTASQRLTVTANVTIAAGTATVTVSPLLEQSILADDIVTVEPFYRSVFNKVFERLLFSDIDLQDLALQAQSRWAKRITDADDPTRLFYKAIKLLALRQMLLPGSEFRQALNTADPNQQGRVEIESMEREVLRLEKDVSHDRVGPRYVEVYR